MPNALTNTALFECSHLRQSLYGKNLLNMPSKSTAGLDSKRITFQTSLSFSLWCMTETEGKEAENKNIYIKQKG